MCALANNMESLLFTVIVLLCISHDAAKHPDCTPGKRMACAAMNLDKGQICYTKSYREWKAVITCDEGTVTGPETYTCQKSTKRWTPSFASSCEKSTGLSEESRPINGRPVVLISVAVLVSVAVLIALAVVIVVLLWRLRRLKQRNSRVFSGKSDQNKTCCDAIHALDRHISLLDLRPDDSVDNDYAEISAVNLNVEAGGIVQTIDSSAKDKTECYGGCKHLKIQTTNFIDNRYSHVAMRQTSDKALPAATDAHTGNASNVQMVRTNEQNESTYDHLVAAEQSEQVGHHGYKTAAEMSNAYLTQDPEAIKVVPDISYPVTNETFKEPEEEESQYHQYFILEKTDTDT